jgi:putative glutathione S-transferase
MSSAEDATVGKLVEGVWHDEWYDTKSTKGAFVRGDSAFRDRVTRDGSSPFKAEQGRYHLYVSLACPWACRTLVFRKLKKLEDAISISIVDPLMGERGWEFTEGPGCIPDTVNGVSYLHQVYTLGRRDYTGRVTVPVLFDKRTKKIVNNESSEIIRMLNREFDDFADASLDFYPAPLRSEIDAINATVYDNVNNGVYKAGFATAQSEYERAFDALFATLDELEKRLARRRYLVGDRITEADWRLFTTLVRFDAVYVSHFKCNLRRLADYENLWGYTRDLYQVPGVAETVNLDHIKRHYFMSHTTINPTRIVPKGPALDFMSAHGRARLGGASARPAAS